MADEAKGGDVLPPINLPDEPQSVTAPEPAKTAEETGTSKTTDGDETAAAAPAESGDEGDEPAPAPKPKGVQKRLDELTRQRRDAERDRDYWRELAMTKSGANPPATEGQTKTETTDTLKPPVEADYEKYEDFQRALARYEVRQEFAAANARQLEADKAAAAARRAETAKAKLLEASKRYEDFERVAFNDEVPISPAMAEAMQDSDKFGDIAYWLGSNPDEAARIAQLSPLAAAREIGKIEDKLLNPPKPKQTSAPPPVKTVKTGDTPTKDPSKMTIPEYRAWREGKKQ